MPSAPDATASSTSSSGTDVKTTSAASATSRGVSRHWRPCSTRSSRVLAVSLLAVDGVAGGEEPGGHVAAHGARGRRSRSLWLRVVDISRPPFDRRDVVVAEIEVCRGDDRVDLVGPAEADDRAVDRGVAQASRRPRPRPASCRGGRRPPAAARPARDAATAGAPGSARCACASRPRAGARSARGSSRRSAGPTPSASTRSRRSARARRRAGARLGLAIDQRVRRLQRLDRRDLLDPPQLLDAEVRDADVADEALLLELGERRPALLDVAVGDRPVDLVEVDRVDPESLEAVARPRAGSSRASGCCTTRPPRPRHERRLGEHVRALHRRARASARPTTCSEWPKPYAAAVSIQLTPSSSARWIAAIDSSSSWGPHAELPAAAADRPRAEADARDLESGPAELGGR